jgi:hypothetical protein
VKPSFQRTLSVSVQCNSQIASHSKFKIKSLPYFHAEAINPVKCLGVWIERDLINTKLWEQILGLNSFQILILIRLERYISLSMALQHCVGPWPPFNFLIFYTVGRTPWTGGSARRKAATCTRTEQTHNKPRQTSMPQVGFEPKIPVFERAKTVHSFARVTSVIGRKELKFDNCRM